MVRRNTTAPAEPAYTPPWVEATEWNGIAQGDPVVVKGTTLSTFTFRSVHIVDGTVIAVNVVGGSKGHNQFRSFVPERVGKPVVKKRRVR
jgi:hypothetical protein